MPDQIIHEFRSLLSRGVFEVIMIAQDLGDYGKDRKEKGALARLLRDMMKEPHDFWLRLLYLYPDEIDDEIISVVASDRRICHYLDIPIQHINDTILSAMGRKTSQSQIRTIISKLKEKIPDIALRTSLIVGFPGETEEQFSELLSFIHEAKFDQVGIFTFSPEKEAAATKLPGQIPEAEIQRRQQILAAAQQKVVKKKNRRQIGRRFSVLIDGPHPDSNLLLRGHTAGQCPEIDGQIIINDAPKGVAIGRCALVEITDAAGYDLIGRVIKLEAN